MELKTSVNICINFSVKCFQILKVRVFQLSSESRLENTDVKEERSWSNDVMHKVDVKKGENKKRLMHTGMLLCI